MAQTRIQTNSRHVTNRMSHIACHISHVTYRMSHIASDILY